MTDWGATRRRALAALVAAAVVAAAASAGAQDWKPTRTVRLVVPAAPGGTTDIAGRLVAAHLQMRWGQSVVVDNKSGGGGTIGSAEVARAVPDGTTLLMGNIGPQAIAYPLYRNLPYRPESLLPVSNVIATPNVLVVHPSVPATTVPEFVSWLTAQGGKVSYASSGTGQSPHLSAAWFLQLAGAQATHVPYRGAAPALNDLIAGQTSFFFDNLSTSLEFIRAGKLRGLAVTSAQRSPHADLPAVRETMPALDKFDVSAWFGVFAPAGTPAAVIAEVNAGIREMLDLDATRQRFAQMGGDPAWTPAPAFARFVADEIAKWTAVIEREQLKLDVN